MRSVAESPEGVFLYRAGPDGVANYRDSLRGFSAADFTAALARASLPKSRIDFKTDMDRVRLEYERMIHSPPDSGSDRANGCAPASSAAPPPPAFDPLAFAERFRGRENS